MPESEASQPTQSSWIDAIRRKAQQFLLWLLRLVGEKKKPEPEQTPAPVQPGSKKKKKRK